MLERALQLLEYLDICEMDRPIVEDQLARMDPEVVAAARARHAEAVAKREAERRALGPSPVVEKVVRRRTR